MIPIPAAALLLALSPAHAEHELEFGPQTAAAVNSYVLANPPLPMLPLVKGAYKFTVLPAVYSGEMDEEDDGGGTSVNTGTYDGKAGALGFSYGLSDRWGVFVWGVGSQVNDGEFRVGCKNGQLSFSSPGCGAEQLMRDVNASFITLSAGLIRSSKSGRFAYFFGPTATKAHVTQTFVDRDATPTVRSDFDMEVDAVIPGVLAGAQWAVPLGSFELNPFVMIGVPLGDSCKSFEVAALRVDTIGTSTDASPDCGGVAGPGTSGAKSIALGAGFGSVGLNLAYKPWGLAVNVTAPILRKLISGGTGTIKMLSVSWSFGNYPR